MGHWELAIAAGVVVVYATLSRRLRLANVTAAMFFTTAGFLVGTDVLGWVELGIESTPVDVLAELALALVLFADAAKVDRRALAREYAVPARLLGIGLPLTIALGAVLAAATIGTISFAEALVLSVVLAPTDAALGEAVVSDHRLPSRVRQGLDVESGLNDGICVPLLLVALAYAEVESSAARGGRALTLLAEQLGYGLAAGVAAGAAGALLARAGSRRKLAESSWLRLLPAGCAALAYGAATALGGSGFIAAFAGGLVYGGMSEHRMRALPFVDEAGELFAGLTFFVFGAAIVGPFVGALTWQIGLYAVLSLTVVRMLPVALALGRSGARARTRLFLGWFGPRGLASIVFAAIVVENASVPHQRTILVAVFTTVLLSVFAHGLSAMPLVDAYARWYRSSPRARRGAATPRQVGPGAAVDE